MRTMFPEKFVSLKRNSIIRKQFMRERLNLGSQSNAYAKISYKSLWSDVTSPCNPARRLTCSEFKPCYATVIRRETQALFSMCLGSRKIQLKSKWNTSCRVFPPYPKGQELLLECSKRKFHWLVYFF